MSSEVQLRWCSADGSEEARLNTLESMSYSILDGITVQRVRSEWCAARLDFAQPDVPHVRCRIYVEGTSSGALEGNKIEGDAIIFELANGHLDDLQILFTDRYVLCITRIIDYLYEDRLQ